MKLSKPNFEGRKFIAGLFIASFLVIPVTSEAAVQTIAYQPRTAEEMIAYLYGRIAQLIEIRDYLAQGGSLTTDSQSLLDQVTVDTHSAIEVGETSAFLRGEVNLYGEATASAWFEYGQDDDFLDQKTRKVSIRSAYDRAVRTEVRYLEDDERYYFRLVAEDGDGGVHYGSVYSFRTDEAD